MDPNNKDSLIVDFQNMASLAVHHHRHHHHHHHEGMVIVGCLDKGTRTMGIHSKGILIVVTDQNGILWLPIIIITTITISIKDSIAVDLKNK